MNMKTKLLLGILVIFLTVGCVSAADDDAVLLTATSDDAVTLTAVDTPVYEITEDTYSTYFDENGTFTVESGDDGANVKLGTLANKTFIFNNPNIAITPLSEDSVITDGTFTLNTGAEGSSITGLTINTNLDDVTVIDNWASNVNIIENDITLTGEAVYNFAAITVHDSENVNVIDNIINIDATGEYAYAIDLYTQYVENATITNAIVSGNKITGKMDGTYIAGLSAMNGVVNSIISDNVIDLEASNLTYGIATAKNYADADKSGNVTIENNNITLKGDMAYGIESASQIDMIINNNIVNVEGNGAVAIGAIGIENTQITNNLLGLNGGTLINSYWDSVPNDNVAILVVGDAKDNTIANNLIIGNNVDGITVTGNNLIDGNNISLSSDENIQVSSYGSSMVMGIQTSSSENTITNNIVGVSGNATYNYGIDVYSYPDTISDIAISNNTVSVESGSNYGAGIYTSAIIDSAISENDVSVTSEGMGYGIVLDGAADSNVISDNNVLVEASNARGIEVTNVDDSIVTGNTIDATGDAVYGIATIGLTNSTVSDNTVITTPGTLEDAYAGWDSILAGQAPIAVLNGTDDAVVENTLVNKFGITTDGSENVLVENNTNLMNDALVVEPTIVQAGSGSNFTGLLLDAEGKPIVGHHLFVNLTRTSSGASKVYEVVSDYNGEFQLPIFLASGDYTAQVSYTGITLNNITYADAETEPVAIKVVDEIDDRTVTVFDVDDLTKTVDEEANFAGTFTSFDGTPIAGQHVKLTLTRVSSGASKTYDVTTDYTGKFTLPITLAPGDYTANVAFDGNDEYQPASTGTVTITVTP